MPKLIVVTRDGEEREIMGESGLSVMEVIRDWGLNIKAECGGALSCATCHNPEKGWTDNLVGSIGIGGQVNVRGRRPFDRCDPRHRAQWIAVGGPGDSGAVELDTWHVPTGRSGWHKNVDCRGWTGQHSVYVGGGVEPEHRGLAAVEQPGGGPNLPRDRT